MTKSLGSVGVPFNLENYMSKISVPVVKAKEAIEFETDDLPEHVFIEALRLGLKTFLNRGMDKIQTKDLEGEELEEAKAAVMKRAEDNAESIRKGTVRIMGAKADKVSGKVMVEARRLAKALVKENMKAQGIKVSYVEAKEITAAANAFLASGEPEAQEIMEQAKTAVEAREQKGASKTTALGKIVGSIKISDSKKAKADKAKAEKKSQLSAAQAGRPRKRSETRADA